MRTIGYWAGCGWQGLTMLMPRVGWRTWQKWMRVVVHVRDVCVCLAAILAWGIVIMAFV